MTYSELKSYIRDIDIYAYAKMTGEKEIIESFEAKGRYAQDMLRRFGVDFGDTKGN